MNKRWNHLTECRIDKFTKIPNHIQMTVKLEKAETSYFRGNLYLWNFDRRWLPVLPDDPIQFPWLEMLAELGDSLLIAREKRNQDFENTILLIKSRDCSYLQRSSGFITTHWVSKWMNNLLMMFDVSATGKEWISVQSYLVMIALHVFEMIHVMDNAWALWTFADWTPWMKIISHDVSFWRLHI